MQSIHNGSVKVALILLCSAFTLFSGNAYSQDVDTRYRVIELGECTAEAINDSGEVALWSGEYWYSTQQSYIWKDGVRTLLPSGDEQTKCLDINNNSYVVGATFYGYEIDPVMWDASRSFIPLDIPEGYGGNVSAARGINDFNEITGSIGTPPYLAVRGFYYTDQMTVIPLFAGFDSTSNVVFESINDMGEVIGLSSIIGENTGFAYFDGIHTILDDTLPMDINNAGHIAGYYVPPGSGSQSWTTGNRAVKWIEYVPYMYDNAGFEATRGLAINDSSVMVGQATYPPRPDRDRAVKYVDEQIIDLNEVIITTNDIILERAVDINNKGEIIAWGYYLPKDWDAPRVSFLLRPSASDITYPGLNDLLVAGETDTIRWDAGAVEQTIDLEYTVDGGSTYRPINTGEIDANEGEYGWEVPDSLLYRHVTIRMTDHETGDSLTVSEEFRIKPYVITRVGDDGEYETYEFDTHRWGFGNNGADVWPGTWWIRFDYQNGTDRFTNLPYSFYPLYLQFATAKSSDFPDWESFVNAFTVTACYDNPALGYYSLTALNRWEAIRGAWGGSCFGIANANALAFLDQDAFRTKYPGYPNYVNPIDVVAGPSVIPVISELFTYQFGNPFKAHDIERQTNSYPTETVEQLKQLFSQDDVPVTGLGFYNNNGDGGHEVLPYRLEQDNEDPEYYYIYLWDNSYTAYEGAIIAINTVSNGNNGTWDAAYGFIDAENWGGERDLFLDLPASEFLSNPTIAKPASPQEMFAVPSGRMEITTSLTASTLITDTEGNSIGSGIIGDIPDAYQLTIRNGSETPPYGYQLPAGDYTVTLSDMTEDTAKLFCFTEEGTFSYKRSEVEPGQTDRVTFNSGLSVMNTGTESKAVNLAYTSNGHDGETLFAIQSLVLSPDDSVHVEPEANDRLILKSFGDATSYDVVIGNVSAARIEVFEHISVPLPENTSHILEPYWTDDAGDQLKILIDEGNDGSVDDSLQVENQTAVEEQTGQAAPSGFRIVGNYPNPFNPQTTISYQLPQPVEITITIYNALGQQVRVFAVGRMEPGIHEVVFDASDLTSGLYFYRVEAGLEVETGKMLYMK